MINHAMDFPSQTGSEVQYNEQDTDKMECDTEEGARTPGQKNQNIHIECRARIRLR